MAITDIIEESSMIETGAPSIKYEGERPLKKQEMLMAGPDWYIKRMELLMDEYGYDYDEAGEIAYDSDKYYEVIGIDPGGMGDESRIMDEEVVEEEGIMRAANGGITPQLVRRNQDGSRPGYKGSDWGPGGKSPSKSSNKSSQSNSPGHPGSSYNNPGPSKNDGPSPYHGGGADPMPVTPVTPTLPSGTRVVDTIMTSPNIGAKISTNPDDLREQYRIGNVPFNSSSMYTNHPYAVGITQPYRTLGLETQRKNNTIDAMNLAGSTYKPMNLPPWVPFSTGINTVKNFLGGMGYDVNTKFFAENVAGKYGYGYGIEDYKQYMKDRVSGKVGAYGNVEQGQNAINARGGDGGGGIMDIYNLVNDTDTETETETEKFVSRFLQNRTPEERADLEEKYKDYYTV